jgi:hypothetical protein
MAALTSLLIGLAFAGGLGASKALAPKAPTAPPNPTDAPKPQTSFVNTATPPPPTATAAQSTAVASASMAAARQARRAQAGSTLLTGPATAGKTGNGFASSGTPAPATLIGS